VISIEEIVEAPEDDPFEEQTPTKGREPAKKNRRS